MENEAYNPDGVDPRTERLICRRLDGALSEQDAAELGAILSSDPVARNLLAEYTELDRLAAEALRVDLNGVRRPARHRSHRGFWIGAASAVLTAAAVLLLSLLLPNPDDRPGRVADSRPFAPVERRVPTIAPSRFVDYREADFAPKRRFGNVHRDLIGIQGRKPNVVYIFERQRQSSRVVPVSGDF